MKRILLIEDDSECNKLLWEVLRDSYEITSAYSGTEALMHKFSSFDLILLDYMLPGVQGNVVLSEIRKKSRIPIIMLTSVSDVATIVEILSQGANDYITKPFDINVLKARIAVQLRNTSRTSPERHTFLNLNYNVNTVQYSIFDNELLLTQKEIALFSLLLENPMQIFTKEVIYEAVWLEEYVYDDNSINVLISGLRKKIRELDPDTDYIETIWGVGVRLARVKS